MRRSKQLRLDLRLRGRGGWRPGAGRKPGPDPRLRHRGREAFHRRFPCHVTLRVRKDVPSLRGARFVRAFERSISGGSERGSFRVVHYSLQSNHAHFIVEAAGREALGAGMKSLGARLARAVARRGLRHPSPLSLLLHLRPRSFDRMRTGSEEQGRGGSRARAGRRGRRGGSGARRCRASGTGCLRPSPSPPRRRPPGPRACRDR